MKRLLFLLFSMILAINSFGQKQLPNDPTVKKGKLPNGLTYYIKHNEIPANRADFYLATNVGAIQETPDQDGLAHFLEHMCFNGTKNFPGSNLIDYLRSIGAEMGANINAFTAVETTVYNLNNIPLLREGVIDTCLLIMHDYSHFVTCSPEEIDKERKVIIEERRSRMDEGGRHTLALQKYLFRGTKYENCTVLGSEENLKTFKPESLTNFYHTWYHPDMQALVVVGDINVDSIEAKIKSIFADIPAAVNPKAKDIIEVPDNSQPIVGIFTDPEAPLTIIDIFWKRPPMPEELNSTDLRLETDVMNSLGEYIMRERFNDIISEPNQPFLNATMNTADIIETMDATIFSLESKDGEGIKAFRALLTEIERMKRYGFTDDELERAKARVLSDYEIVVQGASSRTNTDYANTYVDNFFDNQRYMEPVAEYELVKQICSSITPKILGNFIAKQITNNNIVVFYSAPERQGLTHPVAQDFIKTFDEVKKEKIEQKMTAAVSSELLDTSALKGSAVVKTDTKVLGGKDVTIWTLDNGIKVYVTPFEYQKNTVVVQIEKKGGRSLIPTEDMDSFDPNVIGTFFSYSGISKFSRNELQKTLSGKKVSSNVNIDELSHGIFTIATPDDIETALQLIYLYSTDMRFDENEFQNGMTQLKSIWPNNFKSPKFVLDNELTKVLYGNNPRHLPTTMETLDKANLETIKRVYKDILFKDMAGATVYIVGDINNDLLRPLIEKYIGSLPVGSMATDWKCSNDLVKGSVKKNITMPMETPLSIITQTYTAYLPFTVKNSVVANATIYILNLIYNKTLREEEGGTYSPQVTGNLSFFPESNFSLRSYVFTDPSKTNKIKAMATECMMRLATQGPSAEEVSMAIENLKKNLPENRQQNRWWLLESRLNEWLNIDYDKEFEAAVNSLTSANIQEMFKAFVEQGNIIEVVLSPEAQTK